MAEGGSIALDQPSLKPALHILAAGYETVQRIPSTPKSALRKGYFISKATVREAAATPTSKFTRDPATPNLAAGDDEDSDGLFPFAAPLDLEDKASAWSL